MVCFVVIVDQIFPLI